MKTPYEKYETIADEHNTDVRFEFLAAEVVSGHILVSDAANEYNTSGKEFLKKMQKFGYKPPIYCEKNRELVINRSLTIDQINYLFYRMFEYINPDNCNTEYLYSNPQFSLCGDSIYFTVDVRTLVDENSPNYKADEGMSMTTIQWDCDTPPDTQSPDIEYHLKASDNDPSARYLCHALDICMTEPLRDWDELL